VNEYEIRGEKLETYV